MHWMETLLNQYGKLKIAAEAVELQDNQRVLEQDSAVVNAHHRRYFGDAFKPPETDDVIHIGDQVIHQHAPPPARKRSRAGGLLKMALGAGLLATGVGGGIGIGLILDGLLNRPPAVQPEPPDYRDTDTWTDLELVP